MNKRGTTNKRMVKCGGKYLWIKVYGAALERIEYALW